MAAEWFCNGAEADTRKSFSPCGLSPTSQRPNLRRLLPAPCGAITASLRFIERGQEVIGLGLRRIGHVDHPQAVVRALLEDRYAVGDDVHAEKRLVQSEFRQERSRRRSRDSPPRCTKREQEANCVLFRLR